MNKPLFGKNIIVTGASRGLGLEIAKTLFERGANLLLVARDSKRLEKIRKELLSVAETSNQIHLAALDIGISDDLNKIMGKVDTIWESLYGLVNNAAMLGPIGKLCENKWEAWQETIKVDLLAPVALCRACVPLMAKTGGGKIVNLSGGGATGPRPNFSAYAVAKTGIVRFTEILAEEVKDLNIQVNSIAPGALNTDMLQKILEAGSEQVGAAEHSAALRQVREGGADPKNAAELCAFLLSSLSDNISGKLISAVWDPWQELDSHADDLVKTDIYTLRRISPEDRGKKW